MLVETDISTSGLRSNHKGALITPLRRLLGDTGPHPPWDDSAPIRAELFSVERLEEHARSLAVLWSVMAFAGLGEGDKAAALFWMLNPINHARTRSDIHRYKAEPYVVAADVYAAPAHVGRGGWTWYTGSAGWMQRAGVESILGLRIEGSAMRLEPCIPRSWPRFEIMLQHGASRYEIVVENLQGVQRGVAAAELDGMTITVRPLSVPLKDDGAVHRLQVRLG